jgi:hypothetical protein
MVFIVPGAVFNAFFPCSFSLFALWKFFLSFLQACKRYYLPSDVNWLWQTMDFLQKLFVAIGLRKPQGGPAATSRDGGNSNRGLTRKRQRLQDGFVVSAGMIAPRACTLRDMTHLGGCVDIWDKAVKADLLRGRIILYIPSDRREVDCSVVWRRDSTLGLKFESPFREPTRSYG